MSIIKNYIYNTVYQIMLLFIPLITMPYLTRIFTPDQLGLNTYTLSIVNYFVLFGMLGMQMYANRQIAYVRDDKEKLNKTFSSLYLIQTITTAVSIMLYIVFVSFYVDNKVIYLIQGLNLLACIFDISWFFMGLEDFKKVVIRNSVTKIIGLISIFLFIKGPEDLVLYILITAVINIVGMIVMWMYVPKYITKFSIDKKIIYKNITPLVRLFLPQIATQVYGLLARTMIGVLSTNEQVAFYDYSQKIVMMVLALITSTGVVLMPRVSNIIGKGNKDEVVKLIEKTFEFVSYLSIPMAVGLMCVSKGLVSWFLGPEYLVVGNLVSISSVIIIAVSWANIIGIQYLIGTRQENKYTISIIIAAIINLSMNVILIKMYGALGAIISLITAEFIGPIIQLFLVRKQLRVFYMLKRVSKYFFSAICMAIVLTIIGNVINNAFIANIVQVIVGIGIYTSVLFLLKDTVQREIIDKVFSLVKKTLKSS
ncbi:MAG: oligosaccharide flippase family protein [Clostridium sp.]